MKQKLAKTLTIFVILATLSYLFPLCLSDGYALSYKLLDRPDGSQEYTLNVAIPQSLYEYYRDKDHKLSSAQNFAKFVTPYALKPIADKLLEIYRGDEENFANGVLMIVHQIPYSVTKSAKYPVETMVENSGDCDLLSYIAASIMKAGGLDVVLLYYESKAHMNVGVHLSRVPRDARNGVSYVTYKGVRYYMAECTGGEWEDGWRVGECPSDLKYEETQVIPLENCEQWAPGQVSASYKTLNYSTIMLEASSTLVFQGSTVTLSGQLSPNLPNEIITIYVKTGTSSWKSLTTVKTDSNGKFTLFLNANETGVYYIRASWSGNSDYLGTDSPIISITALSMLFTVFLAAAIALICTGAVAFLMTRKKYSTISEEEQIPEVPSV
ncbi:MAG: Ig-like domain-containing protein [Candidatus Bathyarchaeales archaeon]